MWPEEIFYGCYYHCTLNSFQILKDFGFYFLLHGYDPLATIIFIMNLPSPYHNLSKCLYFLKHMIESFVIYPTLNSFLLFIIYDKLYFVIFIVDIIGINYFFLLFLILAF